MSACRIDHLAIAAPTLAAGADWVAERLGVRPQAGGEHPRMGTHNLLLNLGGRTYLEVIAIAPHLPAPGRPRWFGLDERPAGAAPALAAWVAGADDIRSAARHSAEALGTVEAMSRGALEWLITIPDDGRVPLDGVGPALIEWPADVHPADHMEDSGLSLDRLLIRHPKPERVARMLATIGLEDERIVVQAAAPGSAPGLEALIRTPGGLRSLG